MLPKPKHLGAEYAAQFKDKSIVEAYPYRPPYPAETFQRLIALIGSGPRVALDIGCGTGDITRPLANMVERVDAVDFSPLMIEKGKALGGGANPNINWICDRIEEAVLGPPYGLAVAGESLHWMEWDVALPRLREVLAPSGYLAIVERVEGHMAWDSELRNLTSRFSTNKDFRQYNLITELETRHLFHKVGEIRTAPVHLTQAVSSYIETMHSRNGFFHERMGETQAAEFDAEFCNLLLPFSPEGKVTLQIRANITWGIAEGAR